MTTLATILEIERYLFHDRKNFNFSEIDNLPLSDLYHILITGPTEEKNDDSEDDMTVGDMISSYRGHVSDLNRPLNI